MFGYEESRSMDLRAFQTGKTVRKFADNLSFFTRSYESLFRV